ncbi:MAG TPA: hypothetical protein VMH77_08315 [Steroidobacteraceae bacterium]|nr:hypothetical protein [Steroidobacteraceae bacterium]
MKWLAALLAATTLAFSAGTCHFLHQLRQEQQQDTAPATVPRVAPRRVSMPASAAPAMDPDVATTPAHDRAGGTGKPDPGQIAGAQARLAQLRDPLMRATRARALAELFREQWRPMARELGLTAADIDRIAGVQADQALQYQERRAKCQVDPACGDNGAFEKAYRNAQEERYATNLGPETYARFKAYQESQNERNVVSMLNLLLPEDDALSDAATDRLVQILGEQRHQFARDAAARGEKAAGFDFLVQSAAVAGSADEVARRKESAGAYANHAVELASSTLDSGQLARFREMMEDTLYDYDDYLQMSAVLQATRPATGAQRPDAAHP